MRVGDLVKMRRGYSTPGIVVRIDRDHYGAGSAYKTNPVPRGQAIHARRQPDFIAPTRDGIRDRVMVFWPDEGYSLEDAKNLEVISECG